MVTWKYHSIYYCVLNFFPTGGKSRRREVIFFEPMEKMLNLKGGAVLLTLKFNSLVVFGRLITDRRFKNIPHNHVIISRTWDESSNDGPFS